MRSFRPVYEEEVKTLFAESKIVLGRVTEGKKGLLGRVGSNMDMLKPLTGSMMVLSPSRDKASITQSFADFGAAASSLSIDHSNKARCVVQHTCTNILTVCV